jgi:glucokinase
LTSAAPIIVGDIGGTNARFAAFEMSPRLRMIRSVWFKSNEVKSFTELLEQLNQSELRDSAAGARQFVFAVAGPVVGGTTARLPNLEWAVDISALRAAHGEDRVWLINDFVAQAMATRTPIVETAIPVKPGQADAAGLVAAIGAGTGFGHCSILQCPRGKFTAIPSEAAHQAFAFRSDDRQERDFEAFVIRQLGVRYITGDMIVCGRGLALLHEFHTSQKLSPADVAAKLAADSPVCIMFARFYGRACRHYALAVLPTGGIYLTGGIAARNPILVTHPVFAEEFVASIVHQPLLERIPIWLNVEEESGLWGAAMYGTSCQ